MGSMTGVSPLCVSTMFLNQAHVHFFFSNFGAGCRFSRSEAPTVSRQETGIRPAWFQTLGIVVVVGN